MLDLYKNIKKRRIELGLSQDELARRTGYSSRSMIAKIESGKIDLYQSKIEEIAEALETTPSYLMGWEELSQEETDELKPEYMEMARQLQKEELTDDDFTALLQVFYAFKGKRS